MINNNNNKDDEVAELHEILEARKRAEERLAKIRQLQKRPSVANQGAQEQVLTFFSFIYFIIYIYICITTHIFN